MQRDGVEKRSISVKKQSAGVALALLPYPMAQAKALKRLVALKLLASGQPPPLYATVHAPAAPVCPHLCIAWKLVTSLLQPLQSFQTFNAAQRLRHGPKKMSFGI